jgi:hypothetical protein
LSLLQKFESAVTGLAASCDEPSGSVTDNGLLVGLLVIYILIVQNGGKMLM